MFRFQSESRLITLWLSLISAGRISLCGIAMLIPAVRSTGLLEFAYNPAPSDHLGDLSQS